MNRKSVSAECEEMRCLIELQQQEIRRQQRKIEVQRRRIDNIQDELDTLYGKVAASFVGNRHGTNNRVTRPALNSLRSMS